MLKGGELTTLGAATDDGCNIETMFKSEGAPRYKYWGRSPHFSGRFLQNLGLIYSSQDSSQVNSS